MLENRSDVDIGILEFFPLLPDLCLVCLQQKLLNCVNEFRRSFPTKGQPLNCSGSESAGSCFASVQLQSMLINKMLFLGVLFRPEFRKISMLESSDLCRKTERRSHSPDARGVLHTSLWPFTHLPPPFTSHMGILRRNVKATGKTDLILKSWNKKGSGFCSNE